MTCKYGAIASPATDSMTSRQAARHTGISKSQINAHRAAQCACGKQSEPHLTTESVLTGKVDVRPDGGEFIDVQTEQPVTDWTHIFARFNLDPAEFVIVDDTVRCSTWQQSKALEDGTRDVVNLYSYRARFARKTVEPVDLPALYAAAKSATPQAAPQSTGRSTVIVYTDPQIGKVARRGGTPELLERSEAIRARLGNLLYERNPDRCVILDGGDGFENFNSGGNPMFTNDLSLAGQMDLYGTELFEFINVAHAYGPVTVAGVPSNHTAWRAGKQLLGNPQDDLGLFMHHQVAKVTAAAGMAVDWIQPADFDETVSVDVDGTTLGLVHGNQFAPGQSVQWWEKQTFGAQAVARADVLIHGHYHSFSANVAGRNPVNQRQRWAFGAPTLDNGSDWYRTTAGRDSDPGLLVFDVTADGFDLASLTILTA